MDIAPMFTSKTMKSSEMSSIHKLGKGGESPFFYAFLLKGEQLG